jgi:uncharacterized protein (DUF1810 family)
MSDTVDPFDLNRFVSAQQAVYGRVLQELRAGRKTSHWMWFVFPQLAGLGASATARRYALRSGDEARAYLAHPLLGANLRQCLRLVLASSARDIGEIFGPPDDLKFRSCVTLFAAVVPEQGLFSEALQRFYAGVADARTLELLGAGHQGSGPPAWPGRAKL